MAKIFFINIFNIFNIHFFLNIFRNEKYLRKYFGLFTKKFLKIREKLKFRRKKLSRERALHFWVRV